MSRKYPTLFADLDDPVPSITMGDYTIKFELGPPTEFGEQVALQELGETAETKAKAIKELRELLQEEIKNGLNIPIENDHWLTIYLRKCKYSPKGAFNLITKYFKFKLNNPEVFDNLLPSAEEKILKEKILNVLPLRDQLGRRLVVIDIGKRWNHKLYSTDQLMRAGTLFLEAAIAEPESQIHGGVIIFDMEGFSLGQATACSLSFTRKFIQLLQDVLPLRLRGIHVVNENMFFGMVFALAKPFLNESITNFMHMHGKDMNSLHKYIDADRLPLKYGGTLDYPEVSGEVWYKQMQMFEDHAKAVSQFGYKKQ